MKLQKPGKQDSQKNIDELIAEIYAILSDLHGEPFERLYDVEKNQKLKLAQDALQGKELKCSDRNGKEVKLQASDWLRWVQSDDKGAVAWWHWAHTAKPTKGSKEEVALNNRDEYIISLWHTFNEADEKIGKNKKERGIIEESVTDWSYYQNHFFNWFLNRFDIVRAREVFNKNICSRYVHVFLSLPILAFLIAYFWKQLFSWCCSGALIAVIFILGGLFSLGYNNIEYYFQSLMPRLAVTTSMGYLFLLSSDKLVGLINSDVLLWGEKVIIGFALIFGVGGYMLIAIHRRVQPPMDWLKLIRRTLDIMLLGFTYSAIGLWITEPILLEIQKKETGIQELIFTYDTLFLLTAVALAIGVLLQLVWEERPVTQPL